MQQERPRFFVPREVAKMLRIGINGVNMRRKTGMLKGIRDGMRYIYPVEQFEKFEKDLLNLESEIRQEREKALSE